MSDPNALLSTTPSLDFAEPNKPLSEQERYELENTPEPTFREVYQASSELESSLIGFEKLRRDREFAQNHSYVLPEIGTDEWKELTYGIRPEFIPALAEARSEEHAQYLSDLIREEQDAYDLIAADGASGLATHIGTAIADPVALALGYVTGGAALATKASRLQRFLAAGTLTAAESAALEAYLAEGSPTRDSSDVAMAAVLGFGLGGGLGVIGRTAPEREEIFRIAEHIDRRVVDEVVFRSGVMGDDSAGAARVDDLEVDRDRTLPFDPDGDIEDYVEKAEGKLDRVRIDRTGHFLQSVSNTVRWIGERLASDRVGKASGDVSRADTVSEVAHLMFRTNVAKVYQSVNPALQDWMTRQGVSRLNPIAQYRGREQFFESVGRSLRGEISNDTAVNKAAAAYRQAFADILNEAKGQGRYNNRGALQGFDEVEENANYVPRLYNQGKIRELLAKHDEEDLVRLIQKALEPKLEGLTAKQLRAIAKGHLRKVTTLDTSSILGRSKPLNNMELEDIRGYLETDPAFTPDDIEEVITRLRQTREKEAASPTSRGKRRRALDETASIQTRSGETLRFDDLLENNIETMFLTYAREISGHVAFMRTMGIRSDADWEKLMMRAAQELPQADEEKTLRRLQNTRKVILGRSVEASPGSTGNRVGRVLMDWNFLRLMGQMGFAQLAETGNILKYGPKEAIQQIGALREIRRDMLSGKLKDDLAREVEEFWASGTDLLTNTMHGRHIDHALDIGQSDGILGKIEAAQDVSKYYFQNASLMGPVNTALQRMGTRTILQKFTNMAFGEGKEVTKQRMASIGLDEAMTERIFKQIRAHAKTEKGKLGNYKLRKMNIEQWDDHKARDALIFAVNRESRRLIQENDVGAMPSWMDHLGWKMAFQFRSFTLGAWTQQTLHNLRMKDAQTLLTVLFNSMAAGTAYMAQNYLNSFGREDRQEFLERRLSWEEVAKASFSRAGYASIVPMLADTAITPFADPMFNQRSSNLASSFIMGNPTASLFQSAMQAYKSPRAFQDDYDYSEEDARALTSLLWFSNVTGVRNGLQALRNGLPDYSE